MNPPLTRTEKEIRIAGILLAASLVVELVTLKWGHPTSFLLFLLLGGTLMAAGIVIYLLSLVSHGHESSSKR